MARIRGLIHTHIGMTNSIEALLVTLDLWFTRKPQHSHTLRTLYIIYLLAFLTCWLFHFICIIIFPKPILTPLHHSLSHTHLHSLFPCLIYFNIARAFDHTNYQGIKEPIDPRWNDNPPSQSTYPIL